MFSLIGWLLERLQHFRHTVKVTFSAAWRQNHQLITDKAPTHFYLFGDSGNFQSYRKPTPLPAVGIKMVKARSFPQKMQQPKGGHARAPAAAGAVFRYCFGKCATFSRCEIRRVSEISSWTVLMPSSSTMTLSE